MVRGYEEDARPSAMLAWTAWSWRAGRLNGVTVRISWTLLLVMVFGVIAAIKLGRTELLVLALVLPPLTMLVHAWAHIWTARSLGGQVDETVLWALGDSTRFQAPVTAGKQFAIAAAGPLMSGAIFIACVLGVNAMDPRHEWTWRSLFSMSLSGDGSFATMALSFAAALSFGVMLWNLVPSMLFDGGRLWRAALWPLLGLRRAVKVTIIGGFVVSGLLVALGLWALDPLALLFAVIILFATIQEHRSVQMGFDPVLEVEPDFVGRSRSGAPAGGILARWQQRRREQRQARVEQEEASEQEVLDRLLEKVSANGLPSLTQAERETLQRISKKQKQRLDHAL